MAGGIPGRVSAKQFVVKSLRAMIANGELAPGQQLRQAALAESFGVSTTPIREAFSELASEGLVVQATSRSVVVASAGIADLRENYEIRCALEPIATELATPNLTAAQLDHLDELLEEMSATDDIGYRRALNNEFHTAIYAAAERPRLLELITTLRDAAEIYVSVLEAAPSSEELRALADREHAEINAMLRARRAKQASKLVARHLSDNASRIEERLRARAEHLRDTDPGLSTSDKTPRARNRRPSG